MTITTTTNNNHNDDNDNNDNHKHDNNNSSNINISLYTSAGQKFRSLARMLKKLWSHMAEAEDRGCEMRT